MAEWKYAVEEFIFLITMVSGSFLPLTRLPDTTEITELFIPSWRLFYDAARS
jgi:ABC-type uncharacterized transport system permease subunit